MDTEICRTQLIDLLSDSETKGEVKESTCSQAATELEETPPPSDPDHFVLAISHQQQRVSQAQKAYRIACRSAALKACTSNVFPFPLRRQVADPSPVNKRAACDAINHDTKRKKGTGDEDDKKE